MTSWVPFFFPRPFFAASQPLNPPFHSYKNISYFHVNSEKFHSKHHLNIYCPRATEDTSQLHPVLIFVHGGGWRRGDRNYFWDIYGRIGEIFAQLGFVTVVISYRLAPEFKHPDQSHDVVHALKWAQDHISEYGGDPDRIFLSGHSAGAHLVSLIALDQTYTSKFELKPDSIKGVCALCGIYDVQMLATGGSGWKGSLFGLIARNLYIHPVFGYDEKIWQQASPISYVSRQSPPFLIINASFDLGLEEHTEKFAKALTSHGIPVRTAIIPGTRHGSLIGMSPFANGPHPSVIGMMIEFLKGRLAELERHQDPITYKKEENLVQAISK